MGQNVSALLIIPAATAKFWANNLSRMLILSSVIGGLSGIGGTYISSLRTGLSTGPLIVLLAALFFVFSYLFSPNAGLISRLLQKKKFVYQAGEVQQND